MATTDPSEIDYEQLLISHPYDVNIMAPLEKFVTHQAKTGGYDANANRHLLKLYSIDPDGVKMNIVQQILVLALAQLPNSDFLACTYLLQEDLHEDDHVKGIFKLSTLLEGANFVKFWKEVGEKKMRTILDRVQGFDDSIRTFICTVLESCYQSHPAGTLKDILHVNAKQLDGIAKKRGWTKEDSDGGKLIVFPLGADNQFAEVSTTEKFSMNDLCKTLNFAKLA